MSDHSKETGFPSQSRKPGFLDAALLAALAADAARTGDLETLNRALAEGVPVGAVTPRGDSLLMLACYYEHTAAARLLLEAGADPEQRDARGRRPHAALDGGGVQPRRDDALAARSWRVRGHTRRGRPSSHRRRPRHERARRRRVAGKRNRGSLMNAETRFLFAPDDVDREPRVSCFLDKRGNPVSDRGHADHH